MDSGDTYGAIVDYQKAIVLCPDYEDAYLNIGIFKYSIPAMQVYSLNEWGSSHMVL